MSRITHNSFYSAYTYLSDIYGINITEDLFETMGYVAWSKIGNRQTRMYKVKLIPQKDESGEWFVETPCNADIIEAITTNYEDYQSSSPRTNYPGFYSQAVENFIEKYKFNNSDEYISGSFVNFRQIGDKIYITEPYSSINVLYKGIYVDDNGLPFLNNKEVHAIATYCAYAETYKKGIQTKDSATIQIAQLLKKDWERSCSQARVPQYLNQNELNEILDANSSWNRKLYNKSFKLIQ